jgi:Meiotically up-regulated gene 113
MPLRSSVRPLFFPPSCLMAFAHQTCDTLRTDPADKKMIHLKVGRATNLNRRMDQWGKQCGSKEQILRGFWPGGMDKGGVPMKGLVQAGPKGPWCHRVERLVHIELSDLVEYTPYLEDGYPNVGARKEVKKVGKKDVKRCPDCMCRVVLLRLDRQLCSHFVVTETGNTKHQEIFSFERVMEGRYEGKEWEDIVKTVIEKWGGFVEGFL